MPDIFDVNFDQQATDIFPPDKRLPKNIAVLRAVLKAVQWSRDLLFGSFKTGSKAPKWSPGMYNKYDQVIYNKSVYQARYDGTNATPGDFSNFWELVLPDFIGVDEKLKFNSQKCVLEYALNKRFGGTFRMPPATSLSDIFINNLAPQPYGFRVAKSFGSTVGETNSSDTVGSPVPFKSVFNFQINFPPALYALTSEKEVRDYVDQINAESMNYLVDTY